MTIRRTNDRLRDHHLDGVHGGVRIGQGEGWGDWARRQVPFGDWRTEEQKLNDFQAWDDYNRATGLPGAFGEDPRLKPDQTFLNPREISRDNLWGVTPDELQGLRDLRDGAPDGSSQPPEWARQELDAFINEAEQNRDSLGIDSFGRPNYNPDAGLPPATDSRAEAPLDGGSVATASYEGDTYGAQDAVDTSVADASYADASYADTSYADASYADASYAADTGTGSYEV